MDHLRNLILQGTVAPGDRLPSERELGLAFGLSRSRVREVLTALVSVGMLESRHGSGTYVAEFTPATLAAPFEAVLGLSSQTFAQLLEVRIILETEATRWACQRYEDDFLIDLGRFVAELRARVDDLPGFCRVEAQIHSMIHRASGNAVLVSLMEFLSTLLSDSRLATSGDRRVRELTVFQHERLLAAMTDRDVEEAARAMREHLARLEELVEPDASSDPASRSPTRKGTNHGR